MSYKIRNSIVLAILLLLVMGLGTYIRAFNLPKKLAKVEKEVKRIDEELQNTPNLVNQFNELSAILAEAQKRWENRNKDIPPTDVTGQTYAYFSRLIDLSGQLKLDMVYAGAQSRGNYGFNVYTLKGEAPFRTFYKFIWFLENGRKLYKLNTLSLRGLEVAASEEDPGGVIVTFDMAVHAYFSSVSELASSPGERALTPTYLSADPFNPVISRDLPPNFRNLVEVERSDLKAVIPGKVFVLDQTNTIHTLVEGDEVYLGYVTKIIPDEGRVEFTLNKGGIIEKFQLKIRYGVQDNIVNK
ncbi:MAG TPA: ABC transporter C-terminal domain-containing protein [Bacteroidota bacterium]